MSTLEQRITAALLDATIASTAIAALLEETQTALTEADANIEAERKKALDPLQSPDPVKAREAIGAAEFTRDRLRALQPRLLQHYKKAEAAEYAAAWEADLEQVWDRRDRLAAELRETYPALVAKLVDLLGRIEEVDEEVDRINRAAPPGECRRLDGVELAARDLDSFTARQPSITKGLQLPDFEDSGRLVYPPRQPDHMAMAMYEAAAAHARRLGASCNADWWQAKAAEAAERRQEAERLVAESERKHAEEKKAYEKAVLAADEARRTGGRRG